MPQKQPSYDELAEQVAALEQTVESLQSKVTESEQAENSLAKSEYFLRESQQVAQLGSFFADLTSNTWTSSEELDHIFGIDESYERTLTHWAQIVHPDQRDELNTYWQETVLGAGQSFDREYKIITLDTGEERWVHGLGKLEFDDTGNPIRFIGTVQDITERHQTEQALKQSEEEHRNLFNNEAVGIFRNTVEDGRVLAVNDKIVQLLGYTRDELFSGEVNVPDFYVNQADRIQMLDILKQSGSVQNYQVEMQRKDDSTFWAEYTINLYAEKEYLEGAIIDISKRIQAEEQLRENEARFRSIIENTDAGYFFIDQDGIIRNVNDAWIQMYKYESADEIVGQHFAVIQKVDDLELAKEFVTEIMAGNPDYLTGEFSRKCKDDSIGYHSFSARPVYHAEQVIGIEGFIFDTTEREKAEEALRKSEASLAEAQRIAHIGHWELDIVNNVLTWSDEVFRIFGVEPQAFGATRDAFSSYVHPDDLPNVNQVVEDAFNKVQPFDVEHRIVRGDGSIGVVHELAELIFDKANNPIRMVGTVQDITERKQLIEERTKAAKLESIGHLAGGIAHDFNNKLTGILGNISLARMYADKNDDMQTVLAEAENASLEAKGLTRQLLTFARGGDPVKQSVDVTTLIRNSADFSLKGSNVRCQYNFSDLLWPAIVDPDQITQAIQNVVMNADQAMPGGGDVNIRTENLEITDNETLPVEPGPYVAIHIQDHGAGIPKEYLEKIFDPYYTTKEVGKGTGMGLSIVHGIVKSYKGFITTFTCRV